MALPMGSLLELFLESILKDFEVRFGVDFGPILEPFGAVWSRFNLLWCFFGGYFFFSLFSSAEKRSEQSSAKDLQQFWNHFGANLGPFWDVCWLNFGDSVKCFSIHR